MKNPVLDRIVQNAQHELVAAYGFCGVASADNMALLNSNDGKGNEIRIEIKSFPE